MRWHRLAVASAVVLLAPLTIKAQCTTGPDQFFIHRDTFEIVTTIQDFPSTAFLDQIQNAVITLMQEDADGIGPDTACCTDFQLSSRYDPSLESCRIMTFVNKLDCLESLFGGNIVIVERIASCELFGAVTCGHLETRAVAVATIDSEFGCTTTDPICWAINIITARRFNRGIDWTDSFDPSDINAKHAQWNGTASEAVCLEQRSLGGLISATCTCIGDCVTDNQTLLPNGSFCAPDGTTCLDGLCDGPTGDPGCTFLGGDSDGDSVCDDGDGNGVIGGGIVCAGGATMNCDDNCRDDLNANQGDSDFDEIGDACDLCPDEFFSNNDDFDADQLGDDCDNCPSTVNHRHTASTDCNFDGDASDPGEAVGEQCDEDGDEVGDACDNCESTANPDQTNSDPDQFGDACDTDDDNDGLSDVDELIFGSNPFVADSDNDGLSDLDEFLGPDGVPGSGDESSPTSADTDLDGVGDAADNCRSTSNFTQIDTDSDTRGDACDNCPLVANGPGEDNQADTDGDGVGDACDNCRFRDNSSQADRGGTFIEDTDWQNTPDGIGDACQCGDIAQDGEALPGLFVGDGHPGSLDATIIKRCALFLPPHCPGGVDDIAELDKCDVTGEGLCNSADATIIKRATLGFTSGGLDVLLEQNCPAANP